MTVEPGNGLLRQIERWSAVIGEVTSGEVGVLAGRLDRAADVPIDAHQRADRAPGVVTATRRGPVEVGWLGLGHRREPRVPLGIGPGEVGVAWIGHRVGIHYGQELSVARRCERLCVKRKLPPLASAHSTSAGTVTRRGCEPLA